MKEIFEKLIERLEEEHKLSIEDAERYEKGNSNHFKYAKERGYATAMEVAIKIVNQLAEEYNNGYIPCSEQPYPSTTGYYLVTINGFSRPMYAWWIWTEKKWYYLNSQKEIEDVIAWQTLPPAYQPKGE